MKTVVCIKQIAHTYARTGMDPQTDFLTSEDQVFRINPYDELAVAMALRIKGLMGEGEIVLISLGPIIAEKELRRCLAMGADCLYQIDVTGHMDPWRKSVFLARAIGGMSADLVLCGKESLDNRNGQVGAFVAHHLGLPFVSCIRDISVVQSKRSVEVQRSAGRGMREIIESPLPAVFSVDTGVMDLPFPTYEDKKLSELLPVQKIVFDEYMVLPKTVSKMVFPPRPRPKKTPPPDSRLAAYARIEQLLTGSRVEKRGQMLGGNPEHQVEQIISFLEEHGFL
jgi:electron transfer flavoprotein beta subunit